MTTPGPLNHRDAGSIPADQRIAQEAIYPRCFSTAAGASDVYLREPFARKVAEFFENKGLIALKDEDQREQWYDDWLRYQAQHSIYSSVLSPREYSTRGCEFDLLRYARLLEVVAYFGPSHGYSLQVTFLALFSILMGSNSALKREAVAALENGQVLALGVSEQAHGADLLSNEFTLREIGPGRFSASGTKYYIGNSNVAGIISILGRIAKARVEGRPRRAPPVLFALRPDQSRGFRNIRKIRTLGVRAAYVGEFEVRDHQLASGDIIAEGRNAWDAVLGTVTLGKFFLAFGSIGICERALQEATDHLRRRTLYGKPVLEMPHIRASMSQVYARLTAMKLYAYRALDYVQSASEADRRYLLFCAVQKAKVSTEAVRIMSSLSECVGAKGFESDTYLEMALRDAQLIPLLEGSAHINLTTAAQFIPRYFGRFDADLGDPASLTADEEPSRENPFLLRARSGGMDGVGFPHFLRAYRALRQIPNVRLFVKQVRAFQLFLRAGGAALSDRADTQLALALGKCLATITYGQLVAENYLRLNINADLTSVIFHLLVLDLSAAAMALASLSQLGGVNRLLIMRLVSVPKTTSAEWDAVHAITCSLVPSAPASGNAS